VGSLECRESVCIPKWAESGSSDEGSPIEKPKRTLGQCGVKPNRSLLMPFRSSEGFCGVNDS
jgi:hypothetical protein